MRIPHPLGVLTILTLISSAGASEILFHDDFESGFSPDWESVGESIEIIPDPGDPANHVAAVPPGKDNELNGPPVAMGQWKDALEKSDAMDRWQDYELSFRFRFEKLQNIPDGGEGLVASIFRIGTRIDPVEDNPQEQRHTYIGVWRSSLAWRIKTPHIPWYGQDEPMELPVENPGASADTEWHTMRIVNNEELTEIYFDDELKYSGSDDRAMRGGFNILRWNDGRVDAGMLYIDDVKVTALPSNP